MKTRLHLRLDILSIVAAMFWNGGNVYAQGYGSPLTIQGLSRLSVHSAAASMGGISTGRTGEASSMFTNPTSLRGLEGIQVSVGGFSIDERQQQDQQWFPMRRFPTFSLMMEGLLDSIPAPDYTESPDEGFGPEDSIPRPFDSIRPNWARSSHRRLPTELLVAAPFELGGFKVAAGLGMVQYASLDHAYQNNNVLSPSIGIQRPTGVPLPLNGEEIPVLWSQALQSREGAIYGYGGAVSVSVTENLAVGMSGSYLRGKTDDFETTTVRGRIRFGNNSGVYYYKLDSIYSVLQSVGTSTFTGYDFGLGAAYAGRTVTLSLSIRPPTSIERSARSTRTHDTTGGVRTSNLSIRDRITFPWRGTAGISLAVREDFRLAFEYDYRPLMSAEYEDPSGTVTNPWLSANSFRVGGEYSPVSWAVLRAGYRSESEVFESEGNPLIGDPVRYSVFTAGIGLRVFGARLNLGYEFSSVTYEDLWQTNANLNSTTHERIIADVTYTLF